MRGRGYGGLQTRGWCIPTVGASFNTPCLYLIFLDRVLIYLKIIPIFVQYRVIIDGGYELCVNGGGRVLFLVVVRGIKGRGVGGKAFLGELCSKSRQMEILPRRVLLRCDWSKVKESDVHWKESDQGADSHTKKSRTQSPRSPL